MSQNHSQSKSFIDSRISQVEGEVGRLIDQFSILKSLCDLGIELYIVGGFVRDFLSQGVLKTDLDMEWRFPNGAKASLESKKQEIEDLLKSQKISFEVLPFHILRFHQNETEFELAPARLEEYGEQESYSHCDFEVRFDHTLGTKKLFERRDFSLNALAFKLEKADDRIKLILEDQFEGINSLKEGSLSPIVKDFEKDPVRLLRSIRFKLQHKLHYSDELVLLFSKFNLEKLTSSLFLKEWKKSETFEFLSEFLEIVETHNVKIPKDWHFLFSFKKLSFKGSDIDSCLLDLWSELLEDQNFYKDFAKFFSLSEKVQKCFEKIEKFKKEFDSKKLKGFLKEIKDKKSVEDFSDKDVQKIQLLEQLFKSREILKRYYLQANIQSQNELALELKLFFDLRRAVKVDEGIYLEVEPKSRWLMTYLYL